MKRTLAVLGLLLATPLAVAGEYRDYHKLLTRIADLSDLHYLHPEVKVKSTLEGVAPETIRFVIHAPTGDITIPVDTAGHVDFPLSQALYDQNPDIDSNQPQGTIQIGVGIDVRAEPQQAFDYALLTAMASDYRTGVSRQGLTMRLLAPDPKGLSIKLPKGTPGSANLLLASGPQRFEADVDGLIRIPDRAEWRTKNPRIEVSTMPERVTLDFGK